MACQGVEEVAAVVVAGIVIGCDDVQHPPDTSVNPAGSVAVSGGGRAEMSDSSRGDFEFRRAAGIGLSPASR
jgi:hypothetical protein